MIKQQKKSLGERKSNPQWGDVIDLTPIQQGLLSRIYRVLLKINKKKGKQCSRKLGKKCECNSSKEDVQTTSKNMKRCLTLLIIWHVTDNVQMVKKNL